VFVDAIYGFEITHLLLLLLLLQVDTGVQISHPDLVDAIWTNPGEIPNNGKDDDNNGLIDDVNGWDFKGDDKTPYDDIYDDHGTHMAGESA
jgi:subtilisin family serine protease